MIQEAIEDNMDMKVLRNKRTKGQTVIYEMKKEQGQE